MRGPGHTVDIHHPIGVHVRPARLTSLQRAGWRDLTRLDFMNRPQARTHRYDHSTQGGGHGPTPPAPQPKAGHCVHNITCTHEQSIHRKRR
eukprot:619299-Prymnesium_polylepis.2